MPGPTISVTPGATSPFTHIPIIPTAIALSFARAKEAYDYLRREGLTVKGQATGKPRRPKLRENA